MIRTQTLQVDGMDSIGYGSPGPLEHFTVLIIPLKMNASTNIYLLRQTIRCGQKRNTVGFGQIRLDLQQRQYINQLYQLTCQLRTGCNLNNALACEVALFLPLNMTLGSFDHYCQDGIHIWQYVVQTVP